MIEASGAHLEPEELAAYIDHGLSRARRASVQAHLASCAACREEVTHVTRIVRTAPGRHIVTRRLWLVTAAAAVFALLWVVPRAVRDDASPVLREDAVTMTVPPRLIAPLGTVPSLTRMVWSSVPDANAYRVRLFDADGRTIWDSELSDTVAMLPDSAALAPGRPYFWKVEALTGFDRWASSELAEFRLR